MLVVIDIETKDGQNADILPDRLKDKAALITHLSEITQIAWSAEDGDEGVVQSAEELKPKLVQWRAKGATFGGHNFKFDLGKMIFDGLEFTSKDLGDDSMLMALTLPNKLPEDYLRNYESQRLMAGKHHRKSGIHGLKTLAPYHLGVEPFWESADHNNAEYALTDARYTLRLILKLRKDLEALGYTRFYQKLLVWSRMYLDAELRGVKLNLDLMPSLEATASQEMSVAKENLETLWAEGISHIQNEYIQKIKAKYAAMLEKALSKSKNHVKTAEKYKALEEAAINKLPPFNMASPSQLGRLLKDQLNLDITALDGDESTGKEVLQRLADEGAPGIKDLLVYRGSSKLLTSFFPSYRALQFEGRLHPKFNLDGTRTGRLSSSLPNLQQTSKKLRSLIIPSTGYSMICKDYDNGEPLLLAYASECPVLCDIMLKGDSFHRVNCNIMFGIDESKSALKANYPIEYDIAKTCGLAFIYGAGINMLQMICQKYGRPISDQEARRLHGTFKEIYAKVFQFKAKIDKKLLSGQAVENLLGRPYMLSDPKDVALKGLNTYIQGSLSDLLVQSTYDIITTRPDIHLLGTIHDEVIFETPSDAAEAEAFIDHHMTKYSLTTKLGTIKLKTSGGVVPHWDH